MDNMTICEFDTSRDYEDVIELWKREFAYDTPHNEPNLVIRKKLSMKDGLFFVARSGSSVVGTVMVGYDGHRGWIYSLAVLPEFQRKKIGSILLKIAESSLVELGCPKINLQIAEGNERVVSFYERHGYEVEPRTSMGKRLIG